MRMATRGDSKEREPSDTPIGEAQLAAALVDVDASASTPEDLLAGVFGR